MYLYCSDWEKYRSSYMLHRLHTTQVECAVRPQPETIWSYFLLVRSTITSMKNLTLSWKLFSTSLPWCRCR